MYRLIGVSGPAQGMECDIDAGPVSLGRHPDNTLALPDQQMSRKHCELWKEGGRLCVRDLGAVNGTFVNGQRVVEHDLQKGDRLRVGGCEFVVEAEGEPEQAEGANDPLADV